MLVLVSKDVMSLLDKRLDGGDDKATRTELVALGARGELNVASLDAAEGDEGHGGHGEEGSSLGEKAHWSWVVAGVVVEGEMVRRHRRGEARGAFLYLSSELILRTSSERALLARSWWVTVSPCRTNE